MEILLIASIVMFVIGLGIGVIWRSGFFCLLLASLIVSLLADLFMSFMIGGPLKHYSLGYLFQAAFYFVFPYILLFLLPTFLGALSAFGLKYYRSKG